jgi:DNA (cytosine-5)-methyltransferase 1
MSNKNTKPTIIDLYAGVGGLSLGAIRAGFDLALAVEWDKHAIKAHEINFPNHKHLNTDISKLSGKKLLEEAGLAEGELDGLIGGPPCQGFSVIGAETFSTQETICS